MKVIRGEQEEKFEGMICDKRLIKAHSVTFICVASLDIIAFVLIVLRDSTESKNNKIRYDIAMNCIHVITIVLWSVIQYLMLVVFARYGKPLEDSNTKLIMNKLEALQRAEDKSPQAMALRRHNAYKEIDNRQISEIIKRMNGYSLFDESQNNHTAKSPSYLDSQLSNKSFVTFRLESNSGTDSRKDEEKFNNTAADFAQEYFDNPQNQPQPDLRDKSMNSLELIARDTQKRN